MTILNATEARSKLYSLIDEATETHQPIVIDRKKRQCSAGVRGRLERYF
jgi:PHD/YefM family antitoxin component YafN of YafNO toxin-antitoxin module